MIVQKRGFVWGGLTPLNQRAYGFDFGPFAVVILLDATKRCGCSRWDDANGKWIRCPEPAGHWMKTNERTRDGRSGST